LEKSGRQALGIGVGQNASSHLLDARKAESLLRPQEPAMRAELPFPPLGGPVFQLYQDSETFAGRRPVLGSWVVFGNPAGICVREDIQRTTNNDSCFTPHLVDSAATASLQVQYTPPAAKTEGFAVDLSGTYSLTGYLRGAGVYRCKENSLYLLRGSDLEWMFTDHETGGASGDRCAAIATDSSMDVVPRSKANSAWRIYDERAGEFVSLVRPSSAGSLTITQSSPPEVKADFPLSEEETKLRRELYGKAGGSEREHRTRMHSHVHGGNYYSSSYGPWRTSQQHPSSHQQQQQQQTQRKKQEGDKYQERHGRKSASSRPWTRYGQRQPTGSHGRTASMGNWGGSGGGGGS